MIKRYIILLLAISGLSLYAQSSWTGHAAVAATSEFIGKPGLKRAFSNSFPEGTILQITNPQNGLNVNVDVVGPLKAPGLFLIIEENAAQEIGLPNDHVVTVKASPIFGNKIAEGESNSENYSLIRPISSSDPDYNLKLSIRKIEKESQAKVEDPIENVEDNLDDYTSLSYDLPDVPPVADGKNNLPSTPIVPPLNVIDEPEPSPDTTAVPLVPLVDATKVPLVPPASSDEESGFVAESGNIVNPVPPVPEIGSENLPIDEFESRIEASPVQLEERATPEVIVAYDLSDIEEPSVKELYKKPEPESVAKIELSPEPEEISKLDTPFIVEEYPTPEPVVSPEPTPVDPTPEPVVVPEPTPVDPTPEPVVNPEPTPVDSTPEPVVVPEPTPVDSTPEPVVVPEPTPVVEPEPKPASDPDLPPDSSTIYFLQPSDMRPPQSQPPPPPSEREINVAASVVNSKKLNGVPKVKSGDKKTYVQIASITSLEQFAAAKEKANMKIAGYPLAVLESERNGKKIYKLLVGPLLLGEMGATLKVIRTSSFPGAFKFVN